MQNYFTRHKDICWNMKTLKKKFKNEQKNNEPPPKIWQNSEIFTHIISIQPFHQIKKCDNEKIYTCSKYFFIEFFQVGVIIHEILMRSLLFIYCLLSCVHLVKYFGCSEKFFLIVMICFFEVDF